jgi:hypothetical protein
VRVVKFFATLVYIGYLVQVGLLMTMLPWSEVWSILVLRLPPQLASLMDWPSIKGAVTAFGVLHLMLVAVEVGFTKHPSAKDSG